jgi:DNA polymerase-1
MPSVARQLYLVDGMSLVFRAYHALMRTGLHAPTGEPTFATFGFANMLLLLLRQHHPELLGIAFDTAAPTFRHEQYTAYKATRQAPPEDLAPQLAHIKQLLDALGIARIELPGYEADDLIATLASAAARAGFHVYCVTSDKDFFQLLSERIHILRPAGREGTDYELWTPERLMAEWGLRPEQVVDFLALVGDPVDNVPGVRGIGEKTAAQLLQRFGSLEELYQRLHEVEKPALRERLEQHRTEAFLSRELVRLRTDAPVEFHPEDFARRPVQLEELSTLLDSLALRTVRERLTELVPELQHHRRDSAAVLSSTESILISSPAQLAQLCAELRSAPRLGIEPELSDANPWRAELLGIALATEPGRTYFIPISPGGELLSPQPTLFAAGGHGGGFPAEWVLQQLKPLLESPTLPKYGHNLKPFALLLKRYGIELQPIGFDTMLASYVLNPDEQHTLQALAHKWLSVQLSSPPEGAPEREGSASRLELILRLCARLSQELHTQGLWQLAEQLEFPLVEVLAQMEYNGIAVDVTVLRELGEQFRAQLEQLRQRIYAEAGTEFNIDSPKQLGEVLFERLHLPVLKKTKTGYSTDVSVLSELAPSYPIAGLILEYRQLGKLLSTYIEALPALINPRTGRIHTTYNQAATSTGRLSSSNPNLQNIPVRGERGREIRRAFIAQYPDTVLLSADYSQIELRIMAHMSGDPGLVNAFKAGHDIHAATAAALFGVPVEQVTPEMRRAAKVVNFGIMYGLQPYGLAQRLGIPKSEAHRIIEQYFERYPGIRRYMEETLERARRLGYVETLCGRRRYFPTITSKNQTVRAAAERAAINAPIQGSAADMMKRAMIAIHRRLRSERLRTMMLLQVHDELLFEVPERELATVEELVRTEMQQALSLGEVPVVVEIGIGRNWDEAH